MNSDEFDARLQTLHRRISRIANGEVLPQAEAIADLQTALEEIRVAEEELRQQNEELAGAHLQVELERQRYQDLFQLAPDAYFVTNATGTITQANDSASRLVGVAPSFLPGKALATYIANDDRGRFRALLRGVTGNPILRPLPFRVKPRRRDPLEVELTYSVIRDYQGRLTAIHWILRDATEQQRMARDIHDLNIELEHKVADRTSDLRAARQLSQDLLIREQAARHAAEASEAQSRHVQKLQSIGVLAGGIAHDFNNLLHVVLGNADIALSRLPTDAPAREPLEEVVRATLRAADLTRQLLAYSGKGAFVIRHLDLSREVREMATLLRTAISKQALLVWELAHDLPAIRADATQVRQIVMNLITNASDALGDRGGTITLRTGTLGTQDLERDRFDPPPYGGSLGEVEPGPYVYLEVTDTGAGMTPDILARIFDPFFSTKYSGRGLGLAAVMGIVRAHNGLIRIRTEPDQGTSFRILFPPVTGDFQSSQDPAVVQRDWQGHGTVLVIDDEEGVREVVERMLQELGFATITAADGRQGLELVDRVDGRLTGVLLDVSMPHMGGQETLLRLRERHPTLPVIVMSGYTEEAVMSEQIGDSPTATTLFVQKPFLAEDLITAFRHFEGTST